MTLRIFPLQPIKISKPACHQNDIFNEQVEQRIEQRMMVPTTSDQTQRPIQLSCKVDSLNKRKRTNSTNGHLQKECREQTEINIHEPFRKVNRISIASSQKLDVRIISPTSRGISECSRIIRCSNSSSESTGIVSVPTEKCYSLFCFVPFQKPTRRDPDTITNYRRKSWEMRKLLKYTTIFEFHHGTQVSLPVNHCTNFSFSILAPVNHCTNFSFSILTVVKLRPVHSNEVSIYFHHPMQAYNVVAFSNRKTFLYKQGSDSGEPSNSSNISDGSTLTAVTFSESHEVLYRLSTAFWPGFVTIFAPVRTRRLKCFSMTSSEENDDRLHGHGHGSTDSLNSLVSLSSEGTSLPDEWKHLLASTPVVPDSILKSAHDLQLPADESGVKQYVGMRCPSHPIARKILLDTYGQKDGDLTSRLKGAVIGIHSSSRKLQTCEDVCADLKSIENTQINGDRTRDKPVIHVVNGDDRREQFSVPPCEFGDLSSVSLVIDTPNRTVFLLRDESKSVQVSDPFEIKIADVKRALSQITDHKNVKLRAIAAVMGKWDVTEIKRKPGNY